MSTIVDLFKQRNRYYSVKIDLTDREKEFGVDCVAPWRGAEFGELSLISKLTEQERPKALSVAQLDWTSPSPLAPPKKLFDG